MALTTALVVSAAASIGSAYSQAKAAKAQKKSIAAQQRQADIANARERRNVIRQARVARASVESQAAVTGLKGSSASEGSMANIQSRLGENLSFLSQNQQLSEQASRANQDAAMWASRANTVASIGSLANRFYEQRKTT